MAPETIEEREIRGISAKTLLTIIACTGTIMLSILGTYYSLKAEITDVKTSKDSDSRLNELKMKVLEQKVDYNKIEFEEFKRTYELNKK